MDNDKIRAYLAKKEKKVFPGKEEGGSKYNWLGKWPQDKQQIVIRVLPPLPGQFKPGMEIWKHYQIPGQMKNHTCLQTYDLDCPTCKLLGTFEGQLKLDDWASSGRGWLVCRVVRVLDEKGNELKHDFKTDELTIVALSSYNYEWLLNQFLNPEVGNITDPEKGHNITFQRERDGGKFIKTISLKPTTLGDNPEMTKKLLAANFDLKDIWKDPDDNYLKKIKECGLAIKDVIENRLLTLAEEPADTSSNGTGGESETGSLNPDKDKKEEASKSGNPPNSPGCYGDTEKYYHKDPKHARAQACAVCPFDHMCGEKIAEAGKAG